MATSPPPEATEGSEPARARVPIADGAVDIVVNPITPECIAMRPDWSLGFLTGKVHADHSLIDGVPVDPFVGMLDDAGIGHAFLIAAKAGSRSHEIHYQIDVDYVASMRDQHPERFSLLAGVDPTAGMSAVRELERAVTDLGAVGAHLYPHWFDLAPDDRRCYPIYAKCCELDIPIQIQVGHCLVYSKQRPLRSVGRPITLDTIACDFPELKLVGIHLGWPWTEEMISVAYKHENVYIGGDAYAPAYWPDAFVRFASSWGKNKVLFGTDFPVVDMRRAMNDVRDLDLPEPARSLLMRENALRLYGLDHFDDEPEA